ncbi:CBS domain-containing protein [Cytobacillus firmus]|uniref:CBS domain-containing protein n=1 Tax=Cytobacillus firmus TaxID=1399 RepID=UPI0036D1FAC6
MKTMTQSEKIARFEAAFNRIHVQLKKLVKDPREHAPYGEVLYAARNLHNVVRTHYDLLRLFGKLRNAIVHERIQKDFYIAEPHDEVIEEIERISETLMKPPLALSIASQPVITHSPETSLMDILKIIDTKGFSQIPIYEDNHFQGLLTEGGIAKWLSRNAVKRTISIEDVLVKDILPLEKKHNVKFLSRGSSIYDLEDAFEQSFDSNEKLEAILITEHGSRTQKPIGIVTSWDLVRIDHTTFALASQM